MDATLTASPAHPVPPPKPHMEPCMARFPRLPVSQLMVTEVRSGTATLPMAGSLGDGRLTPSLLPRPGPDTKKSSSAKLLCPFQPCRPSPLLPPTSYPNVPHPTTPSRTSSVPCERRHCSQLQSSSIPRGAGTDVSRPGAPRAIPRSTHGSAPDSRACAQAGNSRTCMHVSDGEYEDCKMFAL
jgi:hypothetical protein